MNMKGGSSETMSTHAQNAAETTAALGLPRTGQSTIGGSSCHGHRRSIRFDHLTNAEVPMPKSKTALLLASILVGSVVSAPSLHAESGMMGMMQGGMMGRGGMMQGSQEGMMKQMSQMMRQMSQLMDQYSNMMSNTRPGDEEKAPSDSDKK